jgi:hypothetical protein
MRSVRLPVACAIGSLLVAAPAHAACTVRTVTGGEVRASGSWAYSGTMDIGSFTFPFTDAYVLRRAVVSGTPSAPRSDPTTVELSTFNASGPPLVTETIAADPDPRIRSTGPHPYVRLQLATVGGHPRVTWNPDLASRFPAGSVPVPLQDLARDWLCPLGHTPAIVHPTLHLAGSQAFATTYQGHPVGGTFSYDLRVQLSDQRFDHPPRPIPGARWPRRDACAAVGAGGPALLGRGYRAHRGESDRSCVLVGPRGAVFVSLSHEGQAWFAYNRRASLGGFDEIGYPRIGFPAFTFLDAGYGSFHVWALARGETIHVFTSPDPGGRRPALSRLVRLTRTIGRHLP